MPRLFQAFNFFFKSPQKQEESAFYFCVEGGWIGEKGIDSI